TNLVTLDISENNIKDLSLLLDMAIRGELTILPNPILETGNSFGHIEEHEETKIHIYDDQETNSKHIDEKQKPPLVEQKDDKESNRLLSIEALILIILLMLVIAIVLVVSRRKKQLNKEA